MSIVFQKGGLSDLTLEHGRMMPYDIDDIDINQDMYLTENMNPKVVDYGGTANFILLQFRNLSKDNYDGSTNGLKTWFQATAINYAENNFTLVDENGVSHTVRLWQNKFKIIKDSSERYHFQIKLLEE